MDNNSINQSDIEKLIKCPVDIRIQSAKHIANFYNKDSFSKQQIAIIEDLFRALLQDKESNVRLELSKVLKSSTAIPKDIIKILCDDIDVISLPVIQESTIIDSKDLIEIIKNSGSETKCLAVSMRKEVNNEVSDALINTKSEKVVGSLLKNKSAKISNSGYDRIVNNYSDKEFVLSSLLERDSLPDTVLTNVTQKIPVTLLNTLGNKYKDRFEKKGFTISKSNDGNLQFSIPISQQEENIYAMARELSVPMDMIPTLALLYGNAEVFSVMVANKLSAEPKLVAAELDNENKFAPIYEKAALSKVVANETKELFKMAKQGKKDGLNPSQIKDIISGSFKENYSGDKSSSGFDYICKLLDKI